MSAFMSGALAVSGDRDLMRSLEPILKRLQQRREQARARERERVLERRRLRIVAAAAACEGPQDGVRRTRSLYSVARAAVRKPGSPSGKGGSPKAVLKPLGRRAWVPDKDANDCQACLSRFGWLTQRRHHCRYCGGVFCDKCLKRLHGKQRGRKRRGCSSSLGAA